MAVPRLVRRCASVWMLANEARTAPLPGGGDPAGPPLPGDPEVGAELAGVGKRGHTVMLGQGELLGDVRHRAADKPESHPVGPVENDGLERDGSESATVHRRAVLSEHHFLSPLDHPQVGGHGAGGPAQVRRGDHVEHGGGRGGDLDAERAERADPPAPASVDRQLAGDE